MTWLNDAGSSLETGESSENLRMIMGLGALICPSCAHPLQFPHRQGGIMGDWGPAGVKFDPSDEQILEHLAAKVKRDRRNLHPLIDQFIPTLEGEDGICYTHPQNLPGMRKDGEIRHFFHRPSKAYTAGTRKRRKVQSEEEGIDTRWHKTGKTRPVLGGGGGAVMGFKKILVLYSNCGAQRKPQKTNWIMHQYHLGLTEHEKDGQLVASKVFFQRQPRHCPSSSDRRHDGANSPETALFLDYCNNNNNIPFPPTSTSRCSVYDDELGAGRREEVRVDIGEFGPILLGDNNASSLVGMGMD